MKFVRAADGKGVEEILNYAPVVVFGYNRADMLENLFRSLEKNKNIDQMDLFIFIDVPAKKKTKDIPLSEKVIEYVNQYKTISKFKKVRIKIADQHKGLAESVIFGVTRVIDEYGKVIVLEDDLEVSNDFLDYMQRGLEFYKRNSKVWSITAHCPMKEGLETYEKDVFLAPRAESLGWGTWRNRWNRMDWEMTSYDAFRKDIVGQALFNLGGNDLCHMLKRQMTDRNYDSWAIRWGYQQFRERKYTVYPKESRVIHCGNDNRSTHGVYYSAQQLADTYKKCKFIDLKPELKIIWKFRNMSSRRWLPRLKNWTQILM